MTKVGIVGYGWVGKAMYNLFPEAIVYDKYQTITLGDAADKRETSMADINTCDITFVCVPTPNGKDGALDTSIVEEVVKGCQSPLIVIRSTVQPGTGDRLAKKYNKKIVIQPEYLGETPSHPFLNMEARGFLIMGGEAKDTRRLINLYTTAYNANITIRLFFLFLNN